jgi:hypothetical protein
MPLALQQGRGVAARAKVAPRLHESGGYAASCPGVTSLHGILVSGLVGELRHGNDHPLSGGIAASRNWKTQVDRITIAEGQ